MKLVGWIAVAIGSLATTAWAQAGNYDASYARYRPTDRAIAAITGPAMSQCMRRAGGVTVNMRECYFAEHDRVDVRLNANYRRIMGRLPQGEQQRLRQSQRRWLTNRYDRCDDEQDGGTLGLIMRDGCVLAELQRRTLWLATL